MQTLSALFFGISSGLASVLLHQSVAPVGLILGLTLSYFSIWYVGRYTGKRIYKFLAACAWVVIALRAGTFGVGRELLIQGDSLGAALMILGLITVALAALRRA
ncbi:MAG: hypothetical protein F2602_00545 [Actinobacteria bacterium]|uniref:Unannotated protein n=1 Tax=freshwater metagenome TaxID=449393 RepID=A0A6J6B790_9ZZZZ|nr:hypothetical protein [Actinomycetota bacterium]MTA20705.1 hypothetical protein [Actinomycetota bacterium]